LELSPHLHLLLTGEKSVAGNGLMEFVGRKRGESEDVCNRAVTNWNQGEQVGKKNTRILRIKGNGPRSASGQARGCITYK